MVESRIRDYKVIGLCLGELNKLQHLQQDKKPKWQMYGLKDVPDNLEKLHDIQVHVLLEKCPFNISLPRQRSRV